MHGRLHSLAMIVVFGWWLLGGTPVGAQSPSTATPDPADRGVGPCDGLAAYEGFYLVAQSSTSSEHPEAVELLRDATESGMDAQAFSDSLIPDDMSVLARYYLALAAVMDEITPPPFAQEWHRLQQESFQLTGEIYGDASIMGLQAAGIAHGSEAADLIERLNAYFAQSNACPVFLIWAREQSVLGGLLA